MTFEEMKQIEPGLGSLECIVIACNNEALQKQVYWADIWIGVKPMLRPLVGFFATREELKTPHAYVTALNHLESLVFAMK